MLPLLRLSLTCITVLLLLAGSISPLAAQTLVELDRLIFEPVLPGSNLPFDVRTTDLPATSDVLSSNLPAGGEQPGQTIVQFEAIENYLSDIAETESREGIYTQDLVQDLISLAALYQQLNRHEEAIEVFNRADHINRINNGLYHPAQFPVVEGMIESYLALADFENALEKQRYLIFLNNKDSESVSVESLPSLINMGNRNLEKFAIAMRADRKFNTPKMGFQLGRRNPGPQIPMEFAIWNLYTAKNQFAQALSIVLNNRLFTHPDLYEMEYRFLETLFLIGFGRELILEPHYYLTAAKQAYNASGRWRFLQRNSAGYETGLNTFERLEVYRSSNPQTLPVQWVQTRLDKADWHLLFGRSKAAAEQYRDAYALAVELNMDSAVIDALFNPDIPVHLPLITAKPNSREKYNIGSNESLDYDGYVDVSFTINENGTARNISFMEMSPATTPGIVQRLKTFLRNSPFRPQLQEGELIRKVPLRLRYNYAFLPDTL